MAAPTKRPLLEALLQKSSVFVRLDGRAAGVALPEWLRADPSVVLQLGYDLAIPIHDLTITDEGISATLSFRRTPFLCAIPWAAVYSLADEEGHQAVFPDDIPPELVAEARGQARTREPLRAVGDGAEPAAAQDPAAPPSPQSPSEDPSPPPPPTGSGGKKPRPSHLKLVK